MDLDAKGHHSTKLRQRKAFMIFGIFSILLRLLIPLFLNGHRMASIL